MARPGLWCPHLNDYGVGSKSFSQLWMGSLSARDNFEIGEHCGVKMYCIFWTKGCNVLHGRFIKSRDHSPTLPHTLEKMENLSWGEYDSDVKGTKIHREKNRKELTYV
jgi:hypothetical protein